jgi:hypothetical protein
MKSIACFDAGLARSATTMQEAERCLLDFIREGVCSDVTHHIREHSCDCDLYLPWFMQVIEYGAPAAVSEPLTIPSLGRLYMDAAWSLVTKGVLRPGPRSVAGGVSANDYGRAFSLFHLEQP